MNTYILFQDDYISAEMLRRSGKYKEAVKVRIHKFGSGEIKIIMEEEDLRKIKGKNVVFIYNAFVEEEPEREFKLFMALNFLKKYSKKITLFTPYLANSRQDRETPGKKESVCLEYYIRLLKESGVEKIVCYDVHSNYAEKYCKENNVEFMSIKHADLFYKNLKNKNISLIVAPDEGASNRAKELSKLIGCKYLIAKKERDYEKGEVKRVVVENIERDYGLKNVVIVDDIISSGKTIEKLINKIRLKEVIVAITHTTLNKEGKNILERLFKEKKISLLMTTNSTLNKDRIKLLKNMKYEVITPKINELNF